MARPSFDGEESIKESSYVPVPPATLRALIKHPLTDRGLEAFLADWEKTGQTIG